ncbi:MAG: hypothetical protein HY078_04040 [Elusimicrobia bacterium]|nr:hypothetical protein [Elusimicrobiota bacterium]
MSPTLAWTLYALCLIAGIVYYLMRAMESTLDRISLPQLLYVMYMMGCSAIVAWVGNDGRIAAVFLAVPLFMVAWFTHSAAPGVDAGILHEIQAKIDLARESLKASSTDPFALECLGDQYREIAEPLLAKPYYARLIEHYAGKTGCERVRSTVQEKLREMELNPGAVTVAKVPELVRACPQCESLALKLAYACPRCGWAFYPDPRTWHVVRMNRFFDRHRFTRVTVFGLCLLPFLFVLGPMPFGVLWGVLTLAFAAGRA